MPELVSGNGNKPHEPSLTVAGARQQHRRSPLPIAIVAALFVVATFLSWHGSWFGRSLSDEEIGKYLADEKNPRHVQHALWQIGERMIGGDSSVKRWYPQVVALTNSPVTEIRQVAAMVMGQDNKAEEFHTSLLSLVEDREPLVRRNAALSLVRFGDQRGRAELRAILQPYNISAPVEGTVSSTLAEGSPVKMGTLLARIKLGPDQIQEVRSPLPGKVRSVNAPEGARVSVGAPLFSLSSDSDSVWESLRALYLIGDPDDMPDVERYARGVEGMPERIKQQAAQTAKAIQSRGAPAQ